MKTIEKVEPPNSGEINAFIEQIDLKLPAGFIDFFSQSNGGNIYNENTSIILWRLTEMIKLNQDYEVNEYADAFFIFGSSGGGTAYCIEKETGYIYDMPFIGMANEEARFICKTFTELLENQVLEVSLLKTK